MVGYTRSQRKPANCSSMTSSMRWMNLARGYSAPQPVQRKTTDRHVRFRDSGFLQWSHLGFCSVILFPLMPILGSEVNGLGLPTRTCNHALSMPYGGSLQGELIDKRLESVLGRPGRLSETGLIKGVSRKDARRKARFSGD